MAAQIVIIAVLLVVLGAGVPVWRSRGEANAVALGGAILSGGIGAVAFGLFAASGDARADALIFTALPLLMIAGGLLAARASRTPRGKARSALLIAAAALTLAGAVSGALFIIAGAAGLIAAGCCLAALGDPPALLRKLDPRD